MKIRHPLGKTVVKNPDQIRDLLDRGILIQNPSGGRSTSYRLAHHDELD